MNKETKEMLSEIEALSESENKNGEKSEIEALRWEKKVRENLSRELDEFAILFPETSVDDIPDEVWEKSRDGEGICAQFALYLRRRDVKKTKADQKNEENRVSAVPDVKREEDEAFFTPEQVEKMSKGEVEKNWTAILESMKKWK